MYGLTRIPIIRLLKCVSFSLLLGFGGFSLAAAEALAETRSEPAAVVAQEQPASNTIDTVEGSVATRASTEGDSAPTADAPGEWMDSVDAFFGDYCVTPMQTVLFYDFGTGKLSEDGKTSVPFIVLWLLFGAVYFTIRMGLINFRGFWHAIRLTKGDYDKPGETGEVSHFQALASALSATVGLGNIAGVAIAVGVGGPGAVFWLILAGVLGMSSKFVECTLGQMYRKVDADGTVSGGAMHYLPDGFAEFGWRPLGAFLGVVFMILCIGASFGGGCIFQVNQSLNSVQEQIPLLHKLPWIYGLVMAILAGIVIIGGIRRIAATAEKIVPFMCGLYVLTAIYILVENYDRVLPAFVLIFESAFSNNALYGGFLGVMVVGIKRAAFSNEAGVGSAPIAHAAAKTEEPVSEGIVALLEPFIDTVVVCTMTGLVIVVTGAYDRTNPEFADLILAEKGAAMTSKAFAQSVKWFPWVLSVAVVLFAFSTMISWSYYGERCWSRIFGKRSSIVYKLLFVLVVFFGSIASAPNVVAFSDMMLCSMAIPNIFGAILLSGKVRRHLDDYWRRYKAGELEPNAPISKEKS